MDFVCDYCKMEKAVIYCKSDSARLCLQCDGCVHSANPLSRRHSRSLICDKCFSQPAVMRCLDENLSICQNCDWNGNGCSDQMHRRQILSFYSGCPSVADLSRMWSPVLEMPTLNDLVLGWSPPLSGISLASCVDQVDNHGSLVTQLDPCSNFEPWMTASSATLANLDILSYLEGQVPFLPNTSKLPDVSLQ